MMGVETGGESAGRSDKSFLEEFPRTPSPLRRQMFICWRDAAPSSPAGGARLHCSCASSLTHLPWTYAEVAALLKSLNIWSAFITLRDTNTHDHLRVRTNESAVVRCAGSRSESLMQLCNTTLFVFPSWPHFFFFFYQLPACFTSHPHLDVC